jgi:Ras-related GTP-binding protein C/D
MDILLLGNRRAGKSSILKVVFQKMSPNETLFLESSHKIDSLQVSNNPFTQFTIVDFPGSFEVSQANAQEKRYLASCSVVIYVLDAQDEPYSPALERMLLLIRELKTINPKAAVEVFVHKADADMYVNDEMKLELLNAVENQIRQEQADQALPELRFHATSIYDHSIYEALSKVVQRITPQVPYLQNMLDLLMSNCRIDKVYVFDVISKLYIATDSTPVDMISYELCSDMIDVVIDVSCIYGMNAEVDNFDQAFDRQSTSVIRLNNGLTLYLREVEHLLALVCLVKEDNFDRQHLIDYNINCFKDGARKIFEVGKTREEVKSR